MDAQKLRAVQSPLKEQYKKSPEKAMVTLRATGSTGQNITCNVNTARDLVEAGLHPATGGDGFAACSGNMLLEALVACAGVTLNAVSTAIGVSLKKGQVSAEGDLDFRGTLAMDKTVAVGLQNVRLHFDLETDASPEELASLLKLTERYCVVLQTLANPPALSVSSTVNGTQTEAS